MAENKKKTSNTARITGIVLAIAGVAAWIFLYNIDIKTPVELLLLISSVLVIAFGLALSIGSGKLLFTTSRLFVGLIFLYSGFVKVVDPLGTAYKFEDYFVAFGADWAVQFALVLSFLMCAAEFLIGLLLLLNIKTKLCSWGVLLFMVVFTPLTLYLAFYDPVSDCGCFGDAFILTNWQTFYKNIYIDVFVLLLFIGKNRLESIFSKRMQIVVLIVLVILTLIFEFYNYRHLPMVDFRAYSEGTHLPDKMVVPEGAPKDIYETVLIYEKDGEKKKYTMDDKPWEDSTLVFVDQESTLVEKGYTPPIHDFNMIITKFSQMQNTSIGEDITDIILEDEGYTFLLVAYDLKKTNSEAMKHTNEIAKYAMSNGHKFLCLTASLTPEIEYIMKTTDVTFGFYATDPITLKTVVRSNPGYVLLKKGTVIKKWHYNDIPDTRTLKEKYLKK